MSSTNSALDVQSILSSPQMLQALGAGGMMPQINLPQLLPQLLQGYQGGMRGAPAQTAPIPQAQNLSSIRQNAGPYMQQALRLAGQGPSSVHVAPPSTNPLMGLQQWLSALKGS